MFFKKIILLEKTALIYYFSLSPNTTIVFRVCERAAKVGFFHKKTLNNRKNLSILSSNLHQIKFIIYPKKPKQDTKIGRK
jgi:hypothetical protein